MTVVFQFVTIFLGAFFAFGLENLREQRRARRWVHEYLGHLFADLEPVLAMGVEVRAQLVATIEDTQAWQRADRADQIGEASWRRLSEVPYANGVDLSAVLRTEAITALEQPMAQALADVERASRLLTLTSEQLVALHQRDVLPLWYERRAPLTTEEIRRVARLESALSRFIDDTDAALASVRQWLEIYRIHTSGGRRWARRLANRRSAEPEREPLPAAAATPTAATSGEPTTTGEPAVGGRHGDRRSGA
ncbi:MAG: hypothetical protein L0Y54_20585 [Sporichthyaceae bacterium]|nr:hypothetical protein [Sporichthyaceae bacterium]